MSNKKCNCNQEVHSFAFEIIKELKQDNLKLKEKIRNQAGIITCILVTSIVIITLLSMNIIFKV